MKLNRHGKAEPITLEIYKKIRESFCEDSHKALFDIAYYTGERWGAILQLKVCDIYQDVKKRLTHEEITFKASTRKDKQTRQVPIHPELKIRLKSYQPVDTDWLFPSSIIYQGHLSFRAADKALRRALVRAGLEHLGFSTHSTRRGFITSLHSKGVPIKTIQALTGHKSLNVLSGYVDITPEQKRFAISAL
jgi:integrase/recombinase XerD